MGEFINNINNLIEYVSFFYVFFKRDFRKHTRYSSVFVYVFLIVGGAFVSSDLCKIKDISIVPIFLILVYVFLWVTGEKQRVAIARAIINNPDIILADEPTGALDSKNKSEIIELLHDLKSKGKSLIIVTHDIELANEFSVEYTFKSQGVIEKIRG